jgi:uncharacterized membrane protein
MNAGEHAMKAKILVVAAACAMFGITNLPGSHVQAQPQNATGGLAMCNMSDFSRVFVAVISRQSAQNWVVKGWHALPNSGCSFVGTFPLGDTVYYYAQGDGVNWAAPESDQSAVAQCIDRDKHFEFVSSNRACPSGQSLARFRMLTLDADDPLFTWTLTGKR